MHAIYNAPDFYNVAGNTIITQHTGPGGFVTCKFLINKFQTLNNQSLCFP